MKIRIYNARILPMTEEKAGHFQIVEGEIQIIEDKIAYVGFSEIAPSGCGSTGKEQSASGADDKWDREIDAQGNLILPGFKNAHTHSGMTFLRSYADDLPLLDWLNKQVFPMEAKLTPEDVYLFSKLAVLEYLTSGITANFDMYLTPDTMAQASKDLGFRTVICGAVNDFVQSVPEMEKWYKTYNQFDPLISYQLGFHAEYTTSKPVLEDIAALAKDLKAPVYMHNSESCSETEQCIDRTGMTPTAYLDNLGTFAHGGGGFHCIHMTEEDLEIFKERGLYVVTNPASNMKLASGIPPLTKMLQMGIPVAIGTDGPASNNCLDMFREMFLVTGLAKLKEKDAAVVDAKEVLYMAAVQGARAIGLADCDSLAPGKQADLIMIDLHQPNMQPLNNLTKNIVYSGSKQNVVMTMIAGKILYEKGEFYVPEDVERLYADVNCRVEELKR